MSTILEQFSSEMAAINARGLRSLVQIRRDGRGIGSGAIWHANGLIVTNAHVVGDQRQRGQSLMIGLADGRELPSRTLAVDAQHDLAALQIEATDLVPFELGDTQRLQAGEMVWALGFPWGVPGGVTLGSVISSVPTAGQHWLAASLHLRPGHSGGPMVDAQGRLVGINTMMDGPNVGVAVPLFTVQQFVQQVLATDQSQSTVWM